MDSRKAIGDLHQTIAFGSYTSDGDSRDKANRVEAGQLVEVERVALEELPSRVTTYRGCFQHNKEGLSWSMDRQIAASFPLLNGYRSKGQPLLITATVEREKILALKNGRDEAEVIAWRPEIQAIGDLKAP